MSRIGTSLCFVVGASALVGCGSASIGGGGDGELPDGGAGQPGAACQSTADCPADQICGSDQTCVESPTGSQLAIAIVATTIADERGDTIDFATGEPIHTHAGAPIALGGSGCPAVYKYGYLLDAAKPAFGSERTPNPIAWRFRPTGTVATADYRVRTLESTKLDWTPVTADADGSFAVAIHRSGPQGIPELTSESHPYFVDLRVRDADQHEAIATGCWEHHPLAAPIAFEGLAAAPDGDALNNFSFAARSPVSKLMGFFEEVKVLRGRIVHQTAEPVTVQFQIPIPVVGYTNSVVTDFVQESAQAGSVYCGVTCAPGHPICLPDPATDPRCQQGTLPDPADTPRTGTLSQGFWLIHAVDAQTGVDAPECVVDGRTVTCSLAPRLVGFDAKELLIYVTTNQLTELKPVAFGAVGEFSFLGIPYTGMAITERAFRCNTMKSVHGTEFDSTLTCTQFTSFVKLQAIDQLRLDIAAPAMPVKTAIPAIGARPGTELAAPPYVPNGALTGTSFLWDSGNADLPGSLH